MSSLLGDTRRLLRFIVDGSLYVADILSVLSAAIMRVRHARGVQCDRCRVGSQAIDIGPLR